MKFENPTIDELDQAWVTEKDKSTWSHALIRTEGGTPKALLANAIAAFRQAPEWNGVLARDEFSYHTVAKKPTPWGFSGQWNEYQDARANEWLQHHGIHVSADVTARAAETVADESRFHPVRDFLHGLVWDGRPRLTKWLSTYLGVEDILLSGDWPEVYYLRRRPRSSARCTSRSCSRCRRKTRTR